MADRDRTERQIKLAEKLQDKLLEYFEKKLESNDLTDTGAAVLSRLLMNSGWTLDPARLPSTLRDKLTSTVDPKDINDDDLDVIAGHITRTA